jgi:hypothetical protein
MTGYIKLIATEIAVTTSVLLARWLGEKLAVAIVNAFDVEPDLYDEDD